MDRADVSTMAGSCKKMGIISLLPWWVKLAAKLVLARLPISYNFWRQMGLFRHGEMNIPERAISTYQAYHGHATKFVTLPPDYQSLELGPGDSVLSGLVARSSGAGCAWLVDAGDFADTDVKACYRLLDLLRAQGKEIPDLDKVGDLSAVLDQANVKYLTNGTESLAEIPDGVIDFFWSQVVLEHVPLAEFPKFLQELRRVVSVNGVGVHSIDFRDHLSGGLNNLRFSKALWESNAFHNSGFYTNRIRPREMIEMFTQAGFEVEQIDETRWPQMPLSPSSFANPFKGLPDEDFMVAEIEIVVRPR